MSKLRKTVKLFFITLPVGFLAKPHGHKKRTKRGFNRYATGFSQSIII